MKTAVIYARYSSDSQTEQSIEGQLRVCEKYAESNDILILKTYIDRAMTGTNDNRPDFQQMIKDSSKKEWDYVLVYKLDRFSRDKFKTAIHKKTLKDNGVKLISATENIPETPEGIILESLLEGMAEYYSAELAQKVSRGMRETRLKGYFQGGTLPYGYKLDGRKIVIDETKVEVVQYIFSQYANGIFVRQIIESLTNKGILKNGKPFATNTIYGMLRNECYTGRYTKNNETFTNMFPRIITDEIYNKVKAKHKTNRYGKVSVKSVYLFRNKLICGYCGKPISAETGTSRHGVKVNYYKCIGIKKYHNGCIKETIRQDLLEEFLLNAICNEFSKQNVLEHIVNKLLNIQKENIAKSTSLNILIKQKKQSQTSLNNIVNAIEQGIINKTTKQRMVDLENQIEELDKQMIIERSRLNTLLDEKDIKEFYKNALLKEPLMLINYLIKEIKLFNDRVEITFNSPINTSPDYQGFLFLSKIKKLKQVLHNHITIVYKEIQVNYYL